MEKPRAKRLSEAPFRPIQLQCWFGVSAQFGTITSGPKQYFFFLALPSSLLVKAEGESWREGGVGDGGEGGNWDLQLKQGNGNLRGFLKKGYMDKK